jgi:exopolysaccharide biosynthesis protein
MDKGPWIYRDETLSVHIEKRKLGGRLYFWAEVYARDGTIPFGGFAYQDASARKRALPYLLARQNRAVFGITGDFVVIGDNPKGVMIRQGKVYKDAKQAPTLAVMPDGELQVFDAGKVTAKELLDMGVKDSFAFGPVLVRDGKIDQSAYTDKRVGGRTNWRAAIGQVEKGHYIVIVNPVGVSLPELAQLFVDNKCTVAYNLDGGHSTAIVFMGEQLYKQAPGEDNGEQRTLTDMLLIGVNSAVPAPSAPVYCNGLGYNAKNRPNPTDGPIN